MKEVKQLDNTEEILKLPNSWEERGVKKGKEEGIKQEKREIALNLLRRGLSEKLIEDVTNLEKSDIEELKKLV